MSLKLTIDREQVSTRAYIDEAVAVALETGCNGISLAAVDEITSRAANELVRRCDDEGLGISGARGSVAEAVDAQQEMLNGGDA